MKPLDPASPAGREAEAALNAVLAGVARRRERERLQAELLAERPARDAAARESA